MSYIKPDMLPSEYLKGRIKELKKRIKKEPELKDTIDVVLTELHINMGFIKVFEENIRKKED